MSDPFIGLASGVAEQVHGIFCGRARKQRGPGDRRSRLSQGAFPFLDIYFLRSVVFLSAR